ncbi:alpha/beta hydrolase [Qaidamihabitans albus]|uniref:alpha/beta hydrolase n=1 Tax=Qaidamihabitans albus TaxID=2795733 RepID=UPI0018F1CFE2|nr:alpha/beta hydrolase-fold protein [Qaidamihabitans albus]
MAGPGRGVGRRTVLAGGAAVVAAGGVLAGREVLRGLPAPEPVTAPGRARVERLYSAARGRHVDLVTLLPAQPPERMPMSLLLHGLGGSARSAAPTGLLAQLDSEVARGAVPPFGFVAIDGGRSYWHEHEPGDDPMAMLLEEVPVWLRQRRLAGADGMPFACTGTSMGGFGALNYARVRATQRRPPAAIALISPALFRSWAKARRRQAFGSRAEWAALEPLRHIGATRGIPTAVWCGTEDRFIGSVREFIARASPAVAEIGPGGHGDTFFRTAVPGLVAFLGRHVPR